MPEFKDSDFRLESWPASKRGGYRICAFRSEMDAGVKVIHKPTGWAEVCNETSSQLENKNRATERLIQRLKVKVP